MLQFRRFQGDRRGFGVERIALFAGAVAIASVVGANVLSRMLQKGEFPVIIFAPSEAQLKRLAKSTSTPSPSEGAQTPKGAEVDLSATATIPGGPRAAAGLSPCDKGLK